MQEQSYKEKKVSKIRLFWFAVSSVFYVAFFFAIIPIMYAIYRLGGVFKLDMARYRSVVGRFWLEITRAWLSVVIGQNMTVACDTRILGAKGRAIVISNHTTYMDWIYIWVALIAAKKDPIIFVAKKEVSSVPILNLGIDMLKFILLTRDKSKDSATLLKGCDYASAAENSCVVIYPEGTFIDKNTKEGADKFLQAQKDLEKQIEETEDLDEKNRLKEKLKIPSDITKSFDRVIFPKSFGLDTIKSSIKSIEYIINCTIFVKTPENAYPSVHYSGDRLFKGMFPDMESLVVCDYEDPEADPEREFRTDTSSYLYHTFAKKDALLGDIDKLKYEQRRKYGDFMNQEFERKNEEKQYEVYTSSSLPSARLVMTVGSLTILSLVAYAIFIVAAFFFRFFIKINWSINDMFPEWTL